jgi:hypothetical protein
MQQLTLFDKVSSEGHHDLEPLLLYALGDFQSRGKVLAGRELALDRLRGAFKRASDLFGAAEIADERAVAVLVKLGAEVTRLPPFVAKHPFRVKIPQALAHRARDTYQTMCDDVNRPKNNQTSASLSFIVDDSA